MKLNKYVHEQDVEEMSDDYLEFEYNRLIDDQIVANAVMAVLLKLEIERRRGEILTDEKSRFYEEEIQIHKDDFDFNERK